MKDNPCKQCPVETCCTKRCRDYAIYIYENNLVPSGSKPHIKKMSYEKSIQFILKCEEMYLYLERVDVLSNQEQTSNNS